jgi:hypothetical protein
MIFEAIFDQGGDKSDSETDDFDHGGGKSDSKN